MAIRFASADKLRSWLKEHHATSNELIIEFFKKGSGKPSVTYPDAVDEALCFGWLDGRVNRVDDERHVQRYTPKKAKSYWSAVNLAKANALIARKRMTAAGLKVFEARDRGAKEKYSFETTEHVALDPTSKRRFRASEKARAFFETQPPGYRRNAIFFVMSAKREETRLRRLTQLIEVSARGERLPQLVSKRPA